MNYGIMAQSLWEIYMMVDLKVHVIRLSITKAARIPT